MGRIILWLIGIVLTIGIAPKLMYWSVKMAELAAEAQRHDQMSYAKFNHALWTKRH